MKRCATANKNFSNERHKTAHGMIHQKIQRKTVARNQNLQMKSVTYIINV